MIYYGDYEIRYKDKLACYIDTPNDTSQTWRVWTVGDYNPGKTEIVFGKEFTNVCRGTDNLAMRFCNPYAEALECAKRMVDMRKFVVDNPTL